MKVYKDDSDEFDPEYLAYLRTLTSEVFEGQIRLTKNSDGELVRIEFWYPAGGDAHGHIDMPLKGWMNPPQITVHDGGDL